MDGGQGMKGTILVTTLWIMALLTLLALGIGIRVGMDIKLISFFLDSSKAHYLAKAGLMKTMVLLEEDGNKNVDSLNEVWACGYDFDDEEDVLKDIILGEGSFTVSYEFGTDEEGKQIYIYGSIDEEGKFNINKIVAELLAQLPGFSTDMAAAVLDWRDEDSVASLEGAEDGYYESLDNPYECKDAPFSVPEELLLVRDITNEIYNDVKDVITVYGEGERVNMNTAPEAVLAVLAGEEGETLVAKIINYRNGTDELPATEDDKIFTNIEMVAAQVGMNQFEQAIFNNLKKYFKFSSNTFRISSKGEVREGRIKKTIEAVVKRSDKGTEVLYYYED